MAGKRATKAGAQRGVVVPHELRPRSRDEGDAPPERTPDFIKAEKNLLSLGFFTPASKDVPRRKSKRVAMQRTLPDGRKVEASVEIVPPATMDLPTTADQDHYLGFMRLIAERRRASGEAVTNPVAFSTAELLRAERKGRGSKVYRDVETWLSKMTLTGIISKGTVYLAGRKTWASDTFHVFNRAVSAGQELEEGQIADRHHVWLSEWQLENINNHHVFPIDFEAYGQLRSSIGKILLPLLQVWLFASRSDGRFAKRYDEFCQVLSIREHRPPSKIRQQLDAPLEELRELGYIDRWELAPTVSGGYKIVFHHGPRFRRELAAVGAADERPGAASDENAPAPDGEAGEDPRVLALMARGVSARAARSALAKLAPSVNVLEVLEYGEFLIQRDPQRFRNPAGFLLHLLEAETVVPEWFEASGQRQDRLVREAAERQRREEDTARDASLWRDYNALIDDALRQRVADAGSTWEMRCAEVEQELRDKGVTERWSAVAVRPYVEKHLRQRLLEEAGSALPTFEEFVAGRAGDER